MQTYTRKEIQGIDKTTLVSYTDAEMMGFDTSETFTVSCGGCGLTSLRTRYQWIAVDYSNDNTPYICVRDTTEKWACATCGPTCL